jgi:hypothetical protein
MIPSAINSDYPKFVPNQVLTSDNLNDLFGYLDEQQRLTRTNLVGIGIVCGLEIKTGTDSGGRYITITKGTGVTSQGFLVTVPETTYHHYNQFDAVRPAYYDRFVNIAAKTQKMPLWELKQSGEIEDADNPFHALTDPANFLIDKVVLIFVELLETNNKNCDPDSCDDKGIMVTVNFRPLLILKSDVLAFLSNYSNQPPATKALSLQELRMPRFDVAATLLLDTQDIFRAYRKILTKENIQFLQSALSGAWTKLGALVNDEFPTDPFAGLDTQFSFLYDAGLTRKQAINLQYFYDLFSDLLAGYEELRKKTFDVVCECIPDESLFPRHLLIGEASGFNILSTTLRTRFIPAGARCSCVNDAEAVRSLFRRLVLMITNFSLDAAGNEDERKKGLKVNATPSVLGKEPLSEKAIPYYYKPNEGSDPLYKSWNFNRTMQGTEKYILSYNSGDYTPSDDISQHPLRFDLEPFNFLRIEGHIGQDYRKVLSELDSLKKRARLPIDVISLGSDSRNVFNIANAIAALDSAGGISTAFEILLKHPSCFADLFLALDEWINKLRCCLLENRRYFYRLPAFQRRMAATEMKILVTKDPATGDTTADDEDTIGNFYEARLKDGTINEKYCGEFFVDIATSKAHHATALVMMPYKIDSMISILPEHITQLDAKALEAKYADMTATSAQLRTLYASPNVAETMTGVDMVQLANRLEMNCLVCLFQELRLLVKEFLLRLLGMMVRQKLGYYAYSNPGIQHKAGVTMGGTFIIVYHEAPMDQKTESRKEFIGTFKNVMMKNGQTAAGLFSGDQALLSAFLLLEEILFMQNVAATENIPDDVLDPIVETIDPGTVIADFYLPYLCSGNCTPTQLLILPAVSTEKPNQPPVADAGEDRKVTLKSGNDTFELDGSKSSDPEGGPLSYSWICLDGPNTPLIDKPADPITPVSGVLPGEYKFQLTVTDDKGASATDTVGIGVIIEHVKTCGPLTDIISVFREWNAQAEQNEKFIKIFQAYSEIVDYFKQLEQVANLPVDQQIDFFRKPNIASLLDKWLRQLHSIIIEFNDLRQLALRLYRILNRLAMYVVCIQDEDFDKAKIKMSPVFELIQSNVNVWRDMIKSGAFTDQEIAVVKGIGKDIDMEIQRVKENGEETVKANYLAALAVILEMIKSVT